MFNLRKRGFHKVMRGNGLHARGNDFMKWIVALEFISHKAEDPVPPKFREMLLASLTCRFKST